MVAPSRVSIRKGLLQVRLVVQCANATPAAKAAFPIVVTDAPDTGRACGLSTVTAAPSLCREAVSLSA